MVSRWSTPLTYLMRLPQRLGIRTRHSPSLLTSPTNTTTRQGPRSGAHTPQGPATSPTPGTGLAQRWQGTRSNADLQSVTPATARYACFSWVGFVGKARVIIPVLTIGARYCCLSPSGFLQTSCESTESVINWSAHRERITFSIRLRDNFSF